MNFDYKDLRDRVGIPPKWWDEHAVPRWEVFHPDLTANIYAKECLLMRILCQSCHAPFDVCLSVSTGDMARAHLIQKSIGRKVDDDEFFLSTQVKSGWINYGDPPNIWCCPGGPSMTSEEVRVLEFWKKDEGDWVRVPELEIVFPPF